jgi:uncharacterized protein (TIGR02246 family)
MHRVEVVVRTFFDRFAAGDSTGMAALFAEDASLMPNGIDTLHGRARIEAFFAGVAERAGIRFDELSFDRVQDLGDTALAETSTSETITRNDNVEVGEFRELFCLQRRGADWWIVSYMGNRPAVNVSGS